MLFKSFTWQEFLVAAVVLSSIWYLVVLPLLYRKQLKVWLDSRSGKRGVESLRKDWEEEFLEPGLAADEVEDDLLGKSRMPEGVSRVGMNMFGFADPLEEDRDSVRSVQQGLVPDAVEELKSIFHILERDKGTKEDFFGLFALVKAKYAGIRDTPSEASLNELIRERALFPISDEELDNLWN